MTKPARAVYLRDHINHCPERLGMNPVLFQSFWEMGGEHGSGRKNNIKHTGQLLSKQGVIKEI